MKKPWWYYPFYCILLPLILLGVSFWMAHIVDMSKHDSATETIAAMTMFCACIAGLVMPIAICMRNHMDNNTGG